PPAQRCGGGAGRTARRGIAAMILARRLSVLWLAVMALLSLASPGRTLPSADPGHQILVMLRIPPDHYRPGAAYAGSYGSAASQSVRHRIAQRVASRHGF